MKEQLEIKKRAPMAEVKKYKTVKGNILEDFTVDAICVPTNGFVKINGESVMGAGIAKAIKAIIPNIAKMVGKQVQLQGNKTNIVAIKKDSATIVAVPSKPIRGGNLLQRFKDKENGGTQFPGWMCQSEPKLIRKSLMELVMLANENNWKRVSISPVGCGNGGLSWNKDVKHIFDEILDDRFTVFTLGGTCEK